MESKPPLLIRRQAFSVLTLLAAIGFGNLPAHSEEVKREPALKDLAGEWEVVTRECECRPGICLSQGNGAKSTRRSGGCSRQRIDSWGKNRRDVDDRLLRYGDRRRQASMVQTAPRHVHHARRNGNLVRLQHHRRVDGIGSPTHDWPRRSRQLDPPPSLRKVIVPRLIDARNDAWPPLLVVVLCRGWRPGQPNPCCPFRSCRRGWNSEQLNTISAGCSATDPAMDFSRRDPGLRHARNPSLEPAPAARAAPWRCPPRRCPLPCGGPR